MKIGFNGPRERTRRTEFIDWLVELAEYLIKAKMFWLGLVFYTSIIIPYLLHHLSETAFEWCLFWGILIPCGYFVVNRRDEEGLQWYAGLMGAGFIVFILVVFAVISLAISALFK